MNTQTENNNVKKSPSKILEKEVSFNQQAKLSKNYEDDKLIERIDINANDPKVKEVIRANDEKARTNESLSPKKTTEGFCSKCMIF